MRLPVVPEPGSAIWDDVGGGGVGKSCITLRFLHDHFEDKYNPTIEDSYMKNNFMVDGVAHNIEIFDTAGQVINEIRLLS